MINYDLIVIGSGSAMNIVDAVIRGNPEIRVAVIDKDEPGGICLTRGCIPSKILLYPAELVRLIEKSRDLGVASKISKVDFQWIMSRMRSMIKKDIDSIREGLTSSPNIDYYHSTAEFVAPYALKVGEKEISSKKILLCTGSKTLIPSIKGLEEVGYLTSDTILSLERLPVSVAIIGGGYIAAEFGHFLAAMGSRVTILGRNPRFLPDEEPEVSDLAKSELGKHITILTNHEVREAQRSSTGKRVLAVERSTGERVRVDSEEILVAAGRGPQNDILHPERAGIELDREGWIKVNEYLETSQPGVWALGDADGKHLFKHVANYESEVVYYNAFLKRRVKVDYGAVPHAVFTYPEVASVGMSESEAVKRFEKEKLRIGFYRYSDTAKGEAMDAHGYFVKVIMHSSTGRVLGAHIIGPYASILIHDIITLMYCGGGVSEMLNAVYIHPALNEVVQRAFGNQLTIDEYHSQLRPN
jgi:mycothione reductase